MLLPFVVQNLVLWQAEQRGWFDAEEKRNEKSINPQTLGGGRGHILEKILFLKMISIPFGQFCCQIGRLSQMFLLARHTGGFGVNKKVMRSLNQVRDLARSKRPSP